MVCCGHHSPAFRGHLARQITTCLVRRLRARNESLVRCHRLDWRLSVRNGFSKPTYRTFYCTQLSSCPSSSKVGKRLQRACPAKHTRCKQILQYGLQHMIISDKLKQIAEKIDFELPRKYDPSCSNKACIDHSVVGCARRVPANGRCKLCFGWRTSSMNPAM